MGRLRLWLQVGCVVAAFTALWTNYDRFTAVEPEEYWSLIEGHAAPDIIKVRQAACADQKFTLREVRDLHKALEYHDHLECIAATGAMR